MLTQILIPLHWIKKMIVNINYLAYFNNVHLLICLETTACHLAVEIMPFKVTNKIKV